MRDSILETQLAKNLLTPLAFLKDLRPATVDFETRSFVNLRNAGGWLYSRDPSTQALCLSYRLPDGTKGRWHRAHPNFLIGESPPPQDLFDHIRSGGLVEAHNAFFEMCIWNNIMVPRHGWPEIQRYQWRCSAARASAASLPRSLEEACAAMELPIQKDMEGNRIMKLLSKPHYDKATKQFYFHETEEDLIRNWDYCDTDVAAEHALSQSLPELSTKELIVWHADQIINTRGLRFDRDMAESALKIADDHKKMLNRRLYDITGIEKGSQRAAVQKWLADNEGIFLPSTGGDIIDWAFKTMKMSPIAKEVCHILRDVNRTSTRKYQTVLNQSDVDDRIRDLVMYHGAGTGRWAGKGIQIHNLPARNLIIKNFKDAAAEIKTGKITSHEDVMKFLSHSIRGTIIPEDGSDLMIADYSAIEARNVLWLANATSALTVFQQGGDIYCDMASGIYGYEVRKDTHPNERQFGKQAILGLGYGMGFITFLLTCRKYGIFFTREDVINIMGIDLARHYLEGMRRYFVGTAISLPTTEAEMVGSGMAPPALAAQKRIAGKAWRRLVEARESPTEIIHELVLMKYTTDVYRNRYVEVPAMWKAQENAAIMAVLKNEPQECGKVTWSMDSGWLHCWLPSGRPIRYREPEIKKYKSDYGRDKFELSYSSVNGTTRKWGRTHTYGGKIVENITQAVARDMLAEAIIRVEDSGIYRVVMHVHDELVAEVYQGEGSISEFEGLMNEIPTWAAGCPIFAEARRDIRYGK